MEGEKNETPIFHSDDIMSSKANSEKEYFVNVIQDPFQQWLLRKKPAKVKVKQEFATPTPEKAVPEEKPKLPQCRTTIRLTTLRLRKESMKYRLPFILLSCSSIVIFILAVIFASMAFSGEKTSGAVQKTQLESSSKVDAPQTENPDSSKNLEKPSKTSEYPESPADPEEPVIPSEEPEVPEEPEPSENPSESPESPESPEPEPVDFPTEPLPEGEINA